MNDASTLVDPRTGKIGGAQRVSRVDEIAGAAS